METSTIIKEIKVQNHTIKVVHDHLMYITVIGEDTDQTVTDYEKIYNELLDSLGENEKFDILADVNKVGKQSPKVRKLWVNFGKDKRIGAVAVFGASLMSKVIVNFVMGLSYKKDLKVFSTEEEAMQWLMKMKIRKNEQ